MKKVKIDFGTLQVQQKLGDYKSPIMNMPAPPSYVMTDDEEYFKYMTSHLAPGSFTTEFTAETIIFYPHNLN